MVIIFFLELGAGVICCRCSEDVELQHRIGLGTFVTFYVSIRVKQVVCNTFFFSNVHHYRGCVGHAKNVSRGTNKQVGHGTGFLIKPHARKLAMGP